ncbi:MAG: hypothetical protein ACOC7X_05760 [Spirochaetota bacterium]
MKNRFKPVSAVLLLCLLLFGIAPTAAQSSIRTSSGLIKSSGWIDWQTDTFVLQVTFEANNPNGPVPLLRSKAETAIQRHLPTLFVEAISSILVNSRHTIGEILIDSSEKTAEFRKTASEGKIISSRFSSDFTEFQRIFHYSLYPTFSRHFITHSRPLSQTAELGYVASGQYSGIVIYVDNPIEVYGSHVNGTLKPALFPRVYDDQMNTIIDMRMVEPDAINSGGMVSYYHTSQIDKVHARVGEVPLYVHAKALFGVRSTDLVVTDRAARKIKADSHTLSLISRGRIAIVSSFSLR